MEKIFKEGMFRFKKLPVSFRNSALISLGISLGYGVVVVRRGKTQKKSKEMKTERACEPLKFTTLGGLFPVEWFYTSIEGGQSRKMME